MRTANPHIPLLEGYDNVMKMVQLDKGEDIMTMVRISHIHLFGMTFIFFVLGLIFVNTRVRPEWLRTVLLVCRFSASWWISCPGT